ncbi:unnamed protein product [Nippostrongylus brasiliensis]|uniref:Uncharacterized protein n=1 Tax=Nippostrongylus brasiliensis TaxID=27835 RepID=A0A0N4Y6G6_NIPBR|nr:hypothetical protein Q1695_001310 [Nippostrongylus brasiliensis]VDL75265.1 unnamed protein product [Nippostrongylus brasiliensis]
MLAQKMDQKKETQEMDEDASYKSQKTTVKAEMKGRKRRWLECDQPAALQYFFEDQLQRQPATINLDLSTWISAVSNQNRGRWGDENTLRARGLRSGDMEV